MDFKRLRILRELADRGSVGATADALGVTPSAVSQQLKTLQDELGVVLLEKSGRGVRLTEAGSAMARAAAEVAVAMARAEATVDTYRSGWQTQVKAGGAGRPRTGIEGEPHCPGRRGSPLDRRSGRIPLRHRSAPD
jgi:DNA-binding transcriptional LysR family regulator